MIRKQKSEPKAEAPVATNSPETGAAAPQVVYVRVDAKGRRVQTIEATGKIWKALMLLSVLLILVGVVLGVIAGSQGMLASEAGSRETGPSTGLVVAAVLTFVGGMIGYIVSRIGAWWFHG